MEPIKNYTLEELQCEALEIENKLHSDDRCQPMSAAEIEKLMQRLEWLWQEIMLYRAPETIEMLEEYSDTQLRRALCRVEEGLKAPNVNNKHIQTDLENFYMAIKYVLWRRERHEYER